MYLLYCKSLRIKLLRNVLNGNVKCNVGKNRSGITSSTQWSYLEHFGTGTAKNDVSGVLDSAGPYSFRTDLSPFKRRRDGH